MKKTMIIIILAVCSFSVKAQKLSTDKVPSPVKNGLTKAHPGVTATWEWENTNYEANFKENGKPVSCVLDKNGTILETETEITQSELPKAVNTYISDHYKGKKIKEIATIRKANGEITYEVAVSGKELIFDQSGKFIKG